MRLFFLLKWWSTISCLGYLIFRHTQTRGCLRQTIHVEILLAKTVDIWNGWVWDSIWVCNVANPIICLSLKKLGMVYTTHLWSFGVMVLGFTVNDSPCFWVIARRGVSAHELLLTWELRYPISICATAATVVVTWLVGNLQGWILKAG